MQFKITDFNQTITITYIGILPDLFREGQGIVAEGQLINHLHFRASQVLAKHDANYMPPEVKAALSQQKSSKLISRSANKLQRQEVNSPTLVMRDTYDR